MKKLIVLFITACMIFCLHVNAFVNGSITKQVYVGSTNFGGTVTEKGTVYLGTSSSTTKWTFSNLTVTSNVPYNYSFYGVNATSYPSTNKAYSIKRTYTITYTDTNTYTNSTTSSSYQYFRTDGTNIW